MVADVGEWLRSLGLDQYAEAFAANDVEPDLLDELNDDDLEKLGVASLGHRKRLLKAIAALQSSASAVAGATATTKTPESPAAAERRQLTVMFCDLVGSTELSGRLDPEDLREVMRRYQDTVAGVVVRFEGHVAKFLGDGVVAFFGWPRAYEDQAERAVRSGLAAIDAVAELKTEDGQTLAARVGIATGQVVIGDIVGESATEADAVAGETPNLAARLQAVAAPGQVVIGSNTRLLVGETFKMTDLGARSLKGFAAPVGAWHVTDESAAESRFEAAHPHLLARLVGRDPELALLRRAWEQSRAGMGQVVLISGEPGIGKSRLVDALGAELKGQGYTRIILGCSPYHSNSSLHPIIAHLRRILGWQQDDGAETKLAKLENVLREFSAPLDEVVPLFAGLLSLELPADRYPPLALMPQQQKQLTLDAVVAWLLEDAERNPVIQVWEDLHWADPSTLELLALEIEQVPTVPILNVLTFRPGFTPPWPQRSHMTPVTLNRLERPEVEVLIAQQAGGKALPEEVVEHIVGKTDGVPLYVEELTKAILEADFLREGSDGYELTGPLSDVTIPATLQDSLMARLDRLPSIREVAQLGAVLGREFAYEMMQAIVSIGETKLQEGLELLVDAELLYQRGRPPRARYLFKHALVQDAAYQSLLKRTRQYYHRQVAEMLETQFAATVATEPELVAHHYTEAGLAEQAVPYWRRAGERAASSWTNAAAANHFEKAINLLMASPESRDRDEIELTLRLALGGALQKTRGHSGDQSVETTYLRAEELSQHVGNPQQRLAALFGQWRYFIWQSRFAKSRGLATQILEVAESTQDPLDLMLANYALGATVLFQGEIELSLEHLEVAASIHDPKLGSSIAFRLGHDPRVTRLSSTGIALWVQGFPEKAKNATNEAIAIANELQDPFTLALANVFSALTLEFRREFDHLDQPTETALAIAVEHDFTVWSALARIHQGSLLAHRGDLETGITRLQEGIDAYEATRQTLFLSYYLPRLAECNLLAGRLDDALRVVGSARVFADETGERIWVAEIHRLEGTITAEIGADIGAAEACFHRALEVARRHGAKSLELRAAISLAGHWRDQAKVAAARDLLAPVYNWFTEGFDTPDLKDAKLLLDELA